LKSSTEKSDNKRNGSYLEYHKNGLIKVSAEYKDNQLIGVYTSYFDNGNTETEMFYGDLENLEGSYKEYYKDGKLAIDANYRNDVRHGPYKKYYKDGKLEIDANYRNNALHDFYKEYHKNGTLAIDTNYRDDVLHGNYEEYDNNGTSVMRTLYVNGQVYRSMAETNDKTSELDSNSLVTKVHDQKRYEQSKEESLIGTSWRIVESGGDRVLLTFETNGYFKWKTINTNNTYGRLIDNNENIWKMDGINLIISYNNGYFIMEGAFTNDSYIEGTYTSTQLSEGTFFAEKQLDQIPPSEPQVKFIPYDKAPVPLTPIRPVYPDIAQEAGIEGQVIVQCFIDKKGKVTETIILKGIPNTGLNESAIAALRKTRFRPAKQRETKVGVWITIPINFTLQN
jgi:TonB family protein